MDKIHITDLNIETIIGVYDWERKAPQTLTFSLEIDCDIRAAASSDDIADTLDYRAITHTVVNFVESSRYQLIETLAEAICALLLATYPISLLTLTLSKPVALHGHNTAKIMITRSHKR